MARSRVTGYFSPQQVIRSAPDTAPQTPECFFSLEEAKHSLENQIKAMYLSLRLTAAPLVSQSSDYAPKTAIAERQNGLNKLSKWLLALEAFVQPWT